MAYIKSETPRTSREHPWMASDAEPSSWSSVPVLPKLSDQEFAAHYRDAMRPVLMPGRCAAWNACKRWSPSYFNEVVPTLNVPVKTYSRSGEIKVSSWPLAEYVRFIIEGSRGDATPETDAGAIPYCHDIPLLGMVESLAEDCRPFPINFLSPWYRRHWWRYSQFFMGPAGTVTPLHFDTLLSHNLFFQIYGTKQFTVFPRDQAKYCGRRGWRWFEIDPEHPDYIRFPEYRQATPIPVTVKAGDILYMPPGTLHHVRSLEPSISFNIDFHTKHSVLHALAQAYEGMPTESAYYNAIAALSVAGKIPESVSFPLYRPYLSYVS
jgi:Cupin-like domain